MYIYVVVDVMYVFYVRMLRLQMEINSKMFFHFYMLLHIITCYMLH